MKFNAVARHDPAVASTAIRGLTRPGSREQFAGRNGELNADNDAELTRRIVELAALAASGKLQDAVEEVASAEERREIFYDAWDNPQKWAELGTDIAASIVDTVARQGVMRRVLSRADVNRGSIPRIRVRHRNVEAVVTNSPSSLGLQMPRDSYVYPDEIYVRAEPYIEDKDIEQGSPDLLTEKHADAIESIMVNEDRILKRGLDRAATLMNEVKVWSGAFSPSIAASLQREVTGWSLPVSMLMMSLDLLSDLQEATAWQGVFSPIAQTEILTTGRIGIIYGMDVWTDGLRNPRLRVLNGGEAYVTSAPETLGAYTDRGPVKSTPRGIEHTGVPGRGWSMSELITVTVANPRAVARGRRIGPAAVR